MKNANVYLRSISALMLISISISAKNIVIPFAGTLFETDLTSQGTHPLSSHQERDLFYQMNTSKPLWYQGSNYFQSNGVFYKHNLTNGLKAYPKFEGNIFHFLIHKDRLCYDERDNRVYCLDLQNNKVKRYTLLELKRGKSISLTASGVFGDRLLMLSRENELWIGGQEGENPHLLASKVPLESISKILVTEKFIYFISNKSNQVSYLHNGSTLPSSISFSHFTLPKSKYPRENVISDDKYLYFLHNDGFIYRVEGEKISSKALNSKKIKIKANKDAYHFNKFIDIMDHNLLYALLKEEETGCDSFQYHYQLHKINLNTGEEHKLIEKEQLVQTVGGCYNPPPPPIPIEAEPIIPWATFSAKADYNHLAYSLREDVNYVELREYLIDQKTGKVASVEHRIFFSTYRKRLSSYPKEIIEKFQDIPFDTSEATDMTLPAPYYPHHLFKIKGFIIKKDNSMWTINEKKDMIWLFDKIDTPAELHQFLRIQTLGREVEFLRYTQNKDGLYTVKTKEKEGNYLYHIQPNGVWHREFITKRSKK